MLALEHGAALIEINPVETPLSPHADQSIRSTASSALVTLVSQLRALRRDNG
jgi:NAD-dependent SIR2 family protein deacetylase